MQYDILLPHRLSLHLQRFRERNSSGPGWEPDICVKIVDNFQSTLIYHIVVRWGVAPWRGEYKATKF